MMPGVKALCYAARVVIERAEWYSPALRRMEQALDAVEREPDGEWDAFVDLINPGAVWEALIDLTLAGTVYMGQHDAQGRHLAEMRMREALSVAVKLVGDSTGRGTINSHVEGSQAGGFQPASHCNNAEAGNQSGRPVEAPASSTLPAHEPATSPGADANAGAHVCSTCCDPRWIRQTYIECPKCQRIERAEVVDAPDLAWPIYVHVCHGCDYTISESEWNEVPAPDSQADGHAERVIPCDPDALRKQSERV